MEKIKATKKEIEEIYEMIPDIEDEQISKDMEHIPEKGSRNFTFEEYTVQYDKEDKEVEENAS